MFSSPMNTRRTPARAAFSMKFGMRWHSVSTWITRLNDMPSCSRSRISRSNSISQLRLRARLSSVMKNRSTPWAMLPRTIASMSSGER